MLNPRSGNAPRKINNDKHVSSHLTYHIRLVTDIAYTGTAVLEKAYSLKIQIQIININVKNQIG